MTPAEQQLVENLFDRMRRLGRVDKDREAEQLIQEAFREVPDAPYLLVQSVLAQEEVLRKRMPAFESWKRCQAAPMQGGAFLAALV